MFARGILRMIERWEREDVCLHGFEVSWRGKLIAEGYYAPFGKGQPHRMYSVSKTMVGLAIGLLMQEGKLSPGDRIADFFPEKLPEKPDPRLMRLTIRDMLRMATCYTKTTYREGVDHEWAASFFTAPASHEPGTLFHYDTSCSQVLGALVQRLSGEPLLDFLQKRVFDPIGAVDDKRWLCDPSGVPQGGTGLIMSLRDLGKTARMLAAGGQGVIPGHFLAEATRRQISTALQQNPEERFGYGYQLWMTRNGWAMYGMGGQMAIVCPEQELVLCTIADTRLDGYGVQRLYDALNDELLAHLDEPDDPETERKLAEKLAALRVPALPHAGGRLEGRFLSQPGSTLRGVRLTKKAATLLWDDGEYTFEWNEYGTCAQGVFPHTSVPCLVSAGLTEDGALRMRCHLIGDAPCGFEMMLQTSGRHASLRMRRSSDPLTNRFEGVWMLTRQG